MATITDDEVRAAYAGEVCSACGGRKTRNSAFCPTDRLALTIWVRGVVDRSLEYPGFFDTFRSALAHLQLFTTRIHRLPVRLGEWCYQSDYELLAAGFVLIDHARCHVPGCGQQICWYRTPSRARVCVNLRDAQPHSTSCLDPEYFSRRQEAKLQTSARHRKIR